VRSRRLAVNPCAGQERHVLCAQWSVA
jgi:hypothetical protein